MPLVFPNQGPGMGDAAMDALRAQNSASPGHGTKPNAFRMSEAVKALMNQGARVDKPPIPTMV